MIGHKPCRLKKKIQNPYKNKPNNKEKNNKKLLLKFLQKNYLIF